MTVMKIDTFLRALEQSNLLQEELLKRVKQRVADGNPNIDPRSVAKWLIEKQYLTLWQANKLLAGRTAFYLGRYKLLDRIGQGGMGVVFKARHAVMDRVVALKVMSHELLDKPQAVARFNREVKTAAALNHPNIITAHDADCVGKTHFLVMEYADGYDLNQWLLARGPLPISAACEFAMQAAVGLGHAHRQGMVHRDIKPVNLLLTWNAEADQPVVKILDLGLARFVSETQEDGGLTRVGQTIGTPDYIAPEAAENFKQADIRADIFSLGCSLFKLLTGRLPYGGTNTMEKLLARANKPAPLVRTIRPEVPEELEVLLARLLATNPEERYQTPTDVAAALAPFAASTLGDQAALEMFRQPPVAMRATAESIEAEADTSLEEFFRDFAVAPLREEGALSPAEPTPRRDDEPDLELLPLDDDPPAKHVGGAAAPPAAAKTPARPADRVPGHATAAAAGKGSASQGAAEASSPKTPRSAPVATRANPAGAAKRKSGPAELEPLDKLTSAGLAAAEGAGLNSVSARGRLGGKRSRNVWDSPLLLISGGALLLLVFAGGALLWATYHQGSAARLTLANDSYRSGAYAQALREYDTFLKDFPQDEQASFARMRRGLVQIRQAAESKSDWPNAYETANRVLKEISGEDKFREGQEELASLLPTIAEGLAQQASQQQKKPLVDQALATLELINRYVPKNLRSGQRLQNIAASLDVTTRQLARHESLEQTVAAMQTAAQSNDTAVAYQARGALLKTYPDLAGDEKLQAAIHDVARAEQARVTPIADLPQPERGEPAGPVVSVIGLGATQTTKPVQAETPVVFGLAGGSTYGMESGTGRLLWRRQLGFDVAWLPLPVSAQTDSDLILTDARRHEVLRVGRLSGEIIWRCGLGDQPVAAGCPLAEQVVVPTANGRAVWFDLESGAPSHALQLPQALSVAPVADRRQRHLYQLADHSNLFVLQAGGEACEEVFYLGHEVGTIAVPPVVASRYLFVLENNRLDNSTLRVLLTDEQGLGIKLVQELSLEGHVQQSPVVEDRSLYVVTDRGAMYLFEIGPPDKPVPLAQLIALPPTSEAHVPHYFAVRGDKLWVGAEQLTSYTIQAARGRFTPDWVKQQKEICAQPLQASGGQLFYGSVQPGFNGIALSCLNAAGVRAWETTLGSPLAGGPFIDQRHIWAMTARGNLFAVDAARQAGRSVNNTAAASIDPTAGLAISNGPLAVAAGKYVFAAPDGPQQLPLADVAAAPPLLSWMKLPDAMAGAATSFAGGVLVPCRGGQVVLLDPTTGRPRLAPFQPSQRGGEQFAWSAPAVLDDRQFVIGDGRAKLYRVESRERPQPHLAAATEVDIPTPIVSPLAALDDQVYGATENGKLLRFRLPALEPLEPLTLEGNVAMGPARVGQQVLVTTDRDRLLCVNPDGTARWNVAMPHGPLAGTPLEYEGAIYCASTRGQLCKIDAQTGAELGVIDLGEALSAGPIADGKRFLTASMDGAVLVTMPPATKAP